jgi:ribonuclease HI
LTELKSKTTSPCRLVPGCFELYLSIYNQLTDVYRGYKKVFTDGSKQGAAVAAAAVTEGKVLVKRLPDNVSIFSAESQAILLALEIISQSYNSDYLICSDSLLCIKSIENRDLRNPLILKILEHLNLNLSSGYTITFVWVPSHIGIAGNTAADATAKAALCLPVSDINIPHTDFKTLVSSYTNSRWQQSWSTEKDNKLYKIQSTVKPVVINRLPRRDEVTIHRLRIGHTPHTLVLTAQGKPT